MTGRRKTAAARRAEIVEAALALAAEIGPQKATAEAIAKRIGVSQPAIFRHFPRKDEMWQAVVQWLADQMRERWTAAGDDPEAVLAAHFDFVARFPAMPLVMLSPELRRGCPAIGLGAQRLMGAFHAVLAASVRCGQQAGRFAAGLSPEDAAHLLLAMVQGTALRWAVGGHRFDLQAEGLRLARLAMAGLKTDGGAPPNT